MVTGAVGFEYAWQAPDLEPDGGHGLVWREAGANYWSGSSGSRPRGTVMLETSGLWVAYVRLEDPPGLSPITTVGAGRRRRPVRSSGHR